jgi:hypothetical protein
MRSQDIFEHQIRSLVKLIQRWHASSEDAAGGTHKALEVRVRDFVSMELLGRGNAEVIARALGELEDAEADRLSAMVNHCSQTFYRTDAVWNAFAVPVAVRWHMQRHRIYIAKSGGSEYLKELAAGIRQCVGAQAVMLDRSIYSAKALFMADARKLHDNLQSLVLGPQRFTAALPTMALHSASEPPWRMAYFLGVEVTGLNAQRRLHDPGVRDALQSYLHLGAEALTIPTSPKFDQGAHGDTVCHHPLYLRDAIRFGEKALRGYRLRQLLEEIAKAETSVTLYYAFNSLGYSFYLLLSGAWLAFEMRWRLFTGETMDEFLRDAQESVDAEAARVECTLVGMELEEFQAMRAESHVGRYRRGRT